MLETFVAISGYVFYLAETKRKEPQSAAALVKSKFQRLVVPALLWGVAYWLLFSGGNLASGLWRVVNGIGHLWFLPMLFWCFLLEKFVVLKYDVQLWILAIIAVLPYPALPFSFNSSLYYLFFFHVGAMLFKHREQLISRANRTNMFYLLALALPLLIINVELQHSIDLPSMSFWPKRAIICLLTSLRFVYSLAIVLAYFIIGIKLRDTRIYSAFRFIAECSFGIYLLQEFIIRFFYYHTTFFHSCEPLLPLLGFMSGFLISLIIVAIVRKTRFGRHFF